MRGHENRPLLGVACMVVAFCLFSVVNLLVKVLGARYPIGEILFFRNLFALIPVTVIAASYGQGAFRTRRLGGHVLRMITGQLSLFCLFTAFVYMPLADAMTISFVTPLIVTALSVPLLGERVGAHRWTAVCVGFAGVVLMLRPTGEVVPVGALFALANAGAYGLATIVVRDLARTEAASTTAFYYSALSTAVLALALPFLWVTPSMGDLALLVLVGTLGGVGQFFAAQAFRYGEASLVAPFMYSSLLWSVVFDLAVFGTRPTGLLAASAALVIASGLYVLRREHRQAARAAGASLGPPRG